jgi:hypothetical protein
MMSQGVLSRWVVVGVVLAGVLVAGGCSAPKAVEAAKVLTWEDVPVEQGLALPANFGQRPEKVVVAANDAEARRRAGLMALASMMIGSYDTAEQAKADPEYFDIRLHMARIWPERSDAVWLYVEQAMSTAQQRPYRQRVYRLTAIDATTFVSEVFELPGDPLRFTGAWQDASRLASVTPEQLVLRQGCEITLRLMPDGTMTGSTRLGACSSSLRGASYATSEVILSPGTLVSWDRGFDSTGQQVWGAVKGGYVFRKQD